MTELLTSAIAWGVRGVPVFPCSDKKRPLTKHGHLDASVDETEIIKMFDAAGTRAVFIGAAMGKESDLFVVDIDLYKDGGKQQRKILEASGCLPNTRVHLTLNDGQHYFYWMPKDEIVKSTKLHSTIDIKGEGGYIIVPASPGYSVLHDRPVAEAPINLIARIKNYNENLKSMSISDLEQQVMSGESFHESLTRIAAKRHARGDDPRDITRDLIRVVDASVARSPEHERHERWQQLMADKGKELSRIARSAAKKFNTDYDDRDFREALKGIKSPFEHESGEASKEDADEFPFTRSYHAIKVEDEPQREYLLYPLIYQNDTVVLSAQPKAGKTLLTMTLALHIASGVPLGTKLLPFGGKSEVSACPVIYFALEGQTVVRKRVQAWIKVQNKIRRANMKEDDLQLFVVERPTNLADGKVRQETVDNIMLANMYFKNRGWGDLGLIVFDTLTKAMPGKNQNDVEDTSSVFEVINMIHNVGVNAAVLFVHHDNREGKGPRGSSNILAEPDTIMTVKKGKNVVVKDEEHQTMELSIFMARAIDDTQKYVFAINAVDLGENSQGFLESAPVVELLEGVAHKDATEHVLGNLIGKAHVLFYTALYNILAENGSMEIGNLHRAMTSFNEAPDAVHYYMSMLKGTSKTALRKAWTEICDPVNNPLEDLSFDIADDRVTLIASLEA